MHTAVDEGPHEDVGEEVLEHEPREQLRLVDEEHGARAGRGEVVDEAEDAGDEEVEEDAHDVAGEAEDAGRAAGQDGEGRAAEVEGLGVRHHVPGVERHRARGARCGCGGGCGHAAGDQGGLASGGVDTVFPELLMEIRRFSDFQPLCALQFGCKSVH